MRKSNADYLYSRGWEIVRTEPRRGGIATIWKSKRTGEEFPTSHAKEVQWQRDTKERQQKHES